MILARLLAALLLIFGLLPIVNWIPGGYRADWYNERLSLWFPGLAIVVGVALIMVITTRRWPALWRTGAWQRVSNRWHSGGWTSDLLLAGASLVAYLVVAQLVFSARPLLIDEIIQVYQARIFASGNLWLPVPEFPELRSAILLVDTGERLYAQFPAGGSAIIAIGTLLGAEWIVGPICAALSVLIFARLLRRVEPQSSTALAAVLLLAFSPFVLFMSGTLMNHVSVLTFLLLAALGLAAAVQDDTPRAWPALWCGLALGIAASIRPLDAATVALPAAAWLLYRLRGGMPHLKPLLVSGVGVAIPMALLMYINWQWTGNPLRFGYEELWGSGVGLGFGASAWGEPHTPMRGLELVNLYLLRLQSHLFETPVPSLLFATVTLGLMRTVRPFDKWMLWCTALLILAYFAYWHDGYYLGPRFLYPIAPWLAWWSVRLPSTLREWRVPEQPLRFAMVSGVLALGIGMLQLMPIRANQYRLGMLTMRVDLAQLARDNGIEHGTILVRESWGAQMIARMWALGVSRPAAEAYYRTTDACALETAIVTIEQQRGNAADLERELLPTRADAPRLVSLTATPDTTLRALPGARYSRRCIRRIEEDKSGASLWPPVLLVQDGNTWIRELHERSASEIDTSRPVWLMTRHPSPGGAIMFERVDTDSMRAEWLLP